MKAKFESIKINFAMFRGSELRNKTQQIYISKEKVSALNNSNSEEKTAVNEIIKQVTFLCGYDDFKIRSIEGTISGGEIE